MIVAITDRRRMQPEDARNAGADFIQVREKDLDGGPLLAFVRAVMATGVPVIVNDRVDVALAAGAFGVHLPERGLAIADARALGARFVGVSRHTLDGVRDALDADLIQLGPIWATPGKGEPLGPRMLEDARQILDLAGSRAKLVAVGGIETRARIATARRAGADGVAAIRAAWSGALRAPSAR